MEDIRYQFENNSVLFRGNLANDESTRNEISIHLSKLASTVVQLYKKTKGRATKDFHEKVKTFHVREGQVKSVRESQEEMESIRDKIKEWKAKHKNLEEETKEIYQEMIVSLTESNKVIGELQKSNRELENYITVLEEATGISAYKGKQVSKEKQKTRTLKCFLSRADTAFFVFSNLLTTVTTINSERKFEADSLSFPTKLNMSRLQS
ncbi:hypothetical protein AWC38_SpisGene23193 [Stylophora pistillata]|uniref:Uncharacterized protein n=1 Tax=Stylophora pistillata TaxID=50429 RepID=A0A2B4R8S8_STYPI|nr:hypothetical protein AWC38_SpisGene23193 [Stylophora pistillata]